MSASVPEEELRAAAARFRLPGPAAGIEPLGRGNIHATFLVSCGPGAGPRRFVLQRINREAFPEPELMMRALARVSEHLAARIPDPRRRLSLLPAEDGAPCWRDGRGEYWRAFVHIDGSVTRQRVDGPEAAREAARAFGAFLRVLRELPAEDFPVRAHFHDTPRRFLRLERAAAADPLGRAREAGPTLAAALKRKALAGTLAELFASGELPERIVHNDTKIDNVLFDAATGEALCVIDLDTLMPGLALYDFGDLARSAAPDAPEDDPDPARVALRPAVYEALARGFVEGAGELLTPAEKRHLARAPAVIAFELGSRFLTDFLEGDRYFRTERPAQNLERARVQLRLAALFAAEEPRMARFIAGLRAPRPAP